MSSKHIIVGVKMVTDRLTDGELAALYLVAGADAPPHGRIFDYETVRGLFTEADGLKMHHDAKAALRLIVRQRLL